MVTATKERNLKEEHYEEILDTRRRLSLAESEAESDAEVAKASKSKVSSLQKQLNNLIAKGPQGSLFNGNGNGNGKSKPKAKPKDKAAEPAKFVDDSWKGVGIEKALTDLTENQREKLAAADALTIGDFENLRAGQNKDYPRGLLDLDRVGEKLITKWEDQIVEWIAKNCEPQDNAKSDGKKAIDLSKVKVGEFLKNMTKSQSDKLHNAGIDTADQFHTLIEGKFPSQPKGLASLPNISEVIQQRWTKEFKAWVKKNGVELPTFEDPKKTGKKNGSKDSKTKK